MIHDASPLSTPLHNRDGGRWPLPVAEAAPAADLSVSTYLP